MGSSLTIKYNQDSKVAKSILSNIDFTESNSLKMSVYAALKKTILNGEIPTGTRINESVISDKIRISRTTLRFALKKLCNEELLVYNPGKGMVVTGVTFKDAYEIFAIRKLLDNLAITTAMNNMDMADFDKLEEIVSVMEKNIHYPDRLYQSFTDFNEFIYKKSNMLRLKALIDEIQSYISYFRKSSVHSGERRAVAVSEHKKIFYYMKHKDKKNLQPIIDRHLNSALLHTIGNEKNL